MHPPILQAALGEGLDRYPAHLIVDLARMTFCSARGFDLLTQRSVLMPACSTGDLEVDLSTLTGESLPAARSADLVDTTGADELRRLWRRRRPPMTSPSATPTAFSK